MQIRIDISKATISYNKTKPGGINDREKGKLTRIECPEDQATDPPEVHCI
jgi:hypothetical protein